jgi:ABC-2 type transport system ATP-binding protein
MAEPIVVARGLGKTYGKKTALAGISAEVEAGDVIGVLGKNGAGKTTLLETLLGFSPPTEGSAQIFGEDCLALSAATKGRIGFVSQQDELLGMLSGQQQLAVTAAFHSSWDRALIDRLIKEWGVPLEQRIMTLSVGERQKLSVLTALGHRPELLLLDEPVASLDPIARRQFLAELFEIAGTKQRTVLFSSHIVSDLERAANKVWIIKDGRLHWQGEIDALKESVVRLHIRSRAPLPRDFTVPDALAVRVEGAVATVAMAQWREERGDALARSLDAAVEVEPLGLEEIFVEMNR